MEGRGSLLIWRLTIITAVSLYLFSYLLFSTNLSATQATHQVQELRVVDLPNDDGTGLLLSWTPLPVESRIIEYRIYRGVSPDSLFLIGTIEVDPTLGITSPRMYFYDRDYTEFVSIYSPSRLRKEVQQPSESPLYRHMPKDLSVYGQYLSHYSVLGIIEKDDFYYRSRPIEITETTDEREETTVYAGLPLRSFDGLYSMLIPEKPYYYAVLSVDNQRRFYPHSEIVEGIALDNPPEDPTEFSAVLFTDTGRLQFEWFNPYFEDDLYERNVYLLTEDQVADMDVYIDQERKRTALDLQQRMNPQNEVIEITLDYTNPAFHILAEPTAFPYSSTITGFIDTIDGKLRIIGTDNQYELDLSEPEKYRFVLSFRDYAGYESFSEIITPRIKTSVDKPVLPEYRITDKPDDKGDYNQLLFGKPLVFMTQGSFLNRDRTKIALNYDYTENRNNRLKTIVFRFYDADGNMLTEVEEFLPDKIIRLSIPSFDTLSRGIEIEIMPEISSDTEEADYILTQTMYYNDEFGFIEYSDLIVREDEILGTDESETVADYSYYLYKRAISDENFRLARNISPFARYLDDSIPYETSIFKLVNRFDLDNNLLLVDSSIGITYDRERELAIETSIFASEIDAIIDDYQQKIAETEAAINETADLLELQDLSWELEYYQNRLWMETEHPVLVEANKIQDNRRRVKFLADIRERHRRSFEYIFIKSDRQGLFYQDDIYKDNDTRYFYPVPNWFDSSQLASLIASLIFGFLVFFFIRKAMKGQEMYIRPIAGLEEIDNAIGRATEMGKPILFVPGIGYIEEIATLAGLSILSNVAKKAAEYDTRVMVPVADYIVLPIAMETVKEAHIAAGRPDTFNRDDIFYISGDQFAFVAGVNGIMVRQKTVANFFLGVFFAEALIMTETGNSQGAIQIAGSDSITQIPFFITTCDYTLIGEELYGASAYLAREPLMLGTLKAQDYFKFLILTFVIVGAILSTLRITFLINAFPSQ